MIMKNKVNFLGAITWCKQYNLSFSEEYRYMETALQQYMSISKRESLDKKVVKETGTDEVP